MSPHEDFMYIREFGLYSFALHDDNANFLGCINYFDIAKLESDDEKGFRVARIFGKLLAASITLATLICILVQCFNKHGKSWLWRVMKWSYAVALVSQGAIFSVWSSSFCNMEDANCVVGSDGIVAIFNLVFLFGMVIATFSSPPPLNPVFRCWYATSGDHDIKRGDTDDDSHDTEKGQLKNKAQSRSTEGDEPTTDSVSLLGSSRSSRRHHSSGKSVRSMSSKKSGAASATGPKVVKLTDIQEQEPLSLGPMTESVTTRGTGVLTSNDAEQQPPGTRFIAREREQGNGTPISQYYRSFKSNFERFENKSTRTAETSNSDDITTVSGPGASQASNSIATEEPVETVMVETVTSEQTTKEATSYVGDDGNSEKGSLRSGSSRSSRKSNKSSKSKSTVSTNGTFILQELSKSVILGKGGTRVSEERIGNTLKIVDEYPAPPPTRSSRSQSSKPSARTDGSEIVKVRTEYCAEGRKTVKETLRPDGSRSITTLVDPVTIEEYNWS